MKSIRASILFFAAVLIFGLWPIQAEDKDRLIFFGFDQYDLVSAGEERNLPSGRYLSQGEVYEGPFYLFVPERFGFAPLIGWERSEISSSVDASGEGLYWGKWSIDFGPNGYFEGNASGKMHPFLDHTAGFALKFMMIAQQGQLQGTFHDGKGGEEEWLLKAISGVSKATLGETNSMDYYGELFVKKVKPRP